MNQSNTTSLTPDNIVAFLGDIFERRGGEEYLGEPVTMAEHMLQGAHFAEAAHEPEVIIVSALLHDIGHFTSEFGTFCMDDVADKFHEDAGAEVLEPFFSTLVTDCVRYHVAAKRYLCATKPSYFKRLSEASIHSLNLQGGPMDADEVAAFENNPNLKEIIKVRYYDEAGKRADLHTKPFAHYAPMVQRIVDAHTAGGVK
ncbi:MAG: HD domain-containing protein [Amylibacter sp.]|nr:HD domain-containing protein [Amylibacter sp.]